MLISHRRTTVAVAVLVIVSSASAAPAQDAPVQGKVSTNERVDFEDDEDLEPVRGVDIPGLAANPADPDHLVLVAEDMLAGECLFRGTVDGGSTWFGGVLDAPEGFEAPPCFEFDVGGYTHMDGSVAFGSDDHVYTTFSAVHEDEHDSVLVARSTDGGRSFDTATVAIPGGDDDAAGPAHQRPKLAVEPRPEGDRVYVVAWRGTFLDEDDVPACGTPCGYHIVTAVSDDGGQTWADPVEATAPRTPDELVETAPEDVAREPSAPAIGPDGEVHLAWRARYDTDTGEDRLRVATSTDHGASWERRVVGGDDELIPGLGLPQMAVADDGTTYVVYQADTSTDDDAVRDIFLRRSTDEGETWSSPQRVNDDPPDGGVDQSAPQIVVGPDDRVHLAWHDPRHAYPGAAGYADVYYATSTDGGETISRNRRITDRHINLDVGLNSRVGTTSFYKPAVAPRSDGSVTFAWPDPRLGNHTTGTQDLYTATLSPSASPAVESIDAPGAPVDVSLSWHAYPGGNERVDEGAAARLVVVGEEDTASALAGSVLARANYSPVLVAGPDGLDERVTEEVERLEPSGAVLVGSAEQLSEATIGHLVEAGVPQDAITRIDGDDPEMAAAVSDAVAVTEPDGDGVGHLAESDEAPEPIEEAVVVHPGDDAAPAGAALAAQLRLPLLFATDDGLPSATADALEARSVERTLIAGTGAWVDAAVQEAPEPTRLDGDDAAAVSERVAGAAAERGVATNVAYLADSATPFRAALLSAAVARRGGLLLINDGVDAAAAADALGRLDGVGPVDRVVTLEAVQTPVSWWLLLAAGFALVGAVFFAVVLVRVRRPQVAEAAPS